MQLEFLAPVELFLSSWTVTVFDPGGMFFFFWFSVFVLCGLSCLHFLGREHSTIVEGQRLGTVHIMEGSCSRLGFFVRNILYMYKNMCVHVCVSFFLLCGAVGGGVGGVGWGGVWVARRSLNKSSEESYDEKVHCNGQERSVQWLNKKRIRSNVFPQDWSSTSLSGKANDWWNGERSVFDLFSNLKMRKIQGFLSVNLWSTW